MAEQSKVFFTNLRTKPGNNLLDKLEKLMRKAGVESIDFKEQFVAIKIHFGEPWQSGVYPPELCSTGGQAGA